MPQVDAGRGITLHEADSLEALARSVGCPLIDMGRPMAEVVKELDQMQVDIMLVSCYARKLPEAIIYQTRYGAFNVHPSLLPAYRGPQPLFWQFRDGVEDYGVSLHRITSSIDAGAVIARQQVRMPDGVNMQQAASIVMADVGELLASGLDKIVSGDTGTIQQESQASYQSYPDSADFRVSCEWPARRIFNFMRATAHMGQAYPCELNGSDLLLRHALDFSAEQPFAASNLEAGSHLIDCKPGQLLASYYQ